MKKTLACGLAILMLAGCAGMTRREQNIFIGSAIGAIFWWPGALLGGYIGSQMK